MTEIKASFLNYLKSNEYKLNKEKHQGYMSKLKNFKKRFNKKGVTNMSIDDYVIGKGSKDSFCYLVEKEFDYFGSIKGSDSSKFGLYYSKQYNSYKIVKKFGTNENEAINNIRKEILSIINSTNETRDDVLKNSKLSNMFKLKIAYLYFPKEILPIYSEAHLDMFLNQLELDIIKSNSYQKNQKLYEYKSKHFPEYDNLTFMQFLYSGYGFEEDLNKSSKLSDDIVIEIVDIKGIEYKTINLTNQTPRKRNYDKVNRMKRQIGSRGEKIVLEYEKKNNLKYANKIERVSLKDDSLGYDIKSYDLNGNEIHIEVKSKSGGGVNNIDFYLTSNELDEMKKPQPYFIYYVFDVDKENPKIIKLSKSNIVEDKLVPIVYRVFAEGVNE